MSFSSQWSPNAKRILFGNSRGEVMIHDSQGNFIVSVLHKLAWLHKYVCMYACVSYVRVYVYIRQIIFCFVFYIGGLGAAKNEE